MTTKIVIIVALIGAALLGFRFWLSKHDARVLEGYVRLSEKVAAEAQLTEMQRQIDAGKIVIASYTEVAKNARKKEEETAVNAEVRIKDYEAKLVTLGRSCGLDASDISELQHDQRTPHCCR